MTSSDGTRYRQDVQVGRVIGMRNLDWGWWGREKEPGTLQGPVCQTQEAGKKGTQNERKVKRPKAKQRSRNR